MIKKILILGGGISKERLISIQTAKAVLNSLKKKNYKAIICEPDGNLTNIIKKFKPDVVFNALHGRFGEDGYIQTILENQKVKYTHSGVLASSIAMDKEISKKIFIKNNILTPKYMKYNFDNNSSLNKNLILKVEKKLNFPVIVKPVNEGSSVDVYICNKKNFIKNVKKLLLYKEILIETFIPGREIQVAIIGKKKLGAIELKPKRKFYDYEAKYNSKAKTKHIIPVELSKTNLSKLMNIALKTHNLIGCRGVTRCDFKFNKNKFYLLEINTQPGMTKLSLVPEIAEYAGISFVELIEWIIKDASIKR
jgi:D-alanine-D-alanine ligase